MNQAVVFDASGDSVYRTGLTTSGLEIQAQFRTEHIVRMQIIERNNIYVDLLPCIIKIWVISFPNWSPFLLVEKVGGRDRET